MPLLLTLLARLEVLSRPAIITAPIRAHTIIIRWDVYS